MLKGQYNIVFNGFILRLSLVYVFLFFVIGIFMPFFPLWLKWKQLSSVEISFVLAAPLFARVIFTPMLSFWADRVGNYKAVVQAVSFGSVMTVLLLLGSNGFWQIFIVALLFSICWTTNLPLVETIAMRGVKQQGAHYGFMRLWGSLSFIAASFGVGYLTDIYEHSIILYLLIAAIFTTFISVFFLPSESKEKTKIEDRASLKDAYAIVRLPVFIAFLVGASLIQTSHAILYSFGTIHWQSLGISSTYIGLLWAIGVIAEIIMFMYTKRLLGAFGPVWLLLLAGFAAVIRWIVMAFDPSLPWLFILQCLHAFTFGLGHLGAIYFISMAIPDKYAATIQGLYAAFSIGFFMGIATLASGTLYVQLEGMAYLVMAVVGLVSIGFNYYVLRVWNGGKVG